MREAAMISGDGGISIALAGGPGGDRDHDGGRGVRIEREQAIVKFPGAGGG
jgi:hypothetical protein